jgi:hypothetical protein
MFEFLKRIQIRIMVLLFGGDVEKVPREKSGKTLPSEAVEKIPERGRMPQSEFARKSSERPAMVTHSGTRRDFALPPCPLKSALIAPTAPFKD